MSMNAVFLSFCKINVLLYQQCCMFLRTGTVVCQQLLSGTVDCSPTKRGAVKSISVCPVLHTQFYFRSVLFYAVLG